MLTGVNSLFADRINDEGKKFNNIGLQMSQKNNNCGVATAATFVLPKKSFIKKSRKNIFKKRFRN